MKNPIGGQRLNLDVEAGEIPQERFSFFSRNALPSFRYD
jgi:hypothetical protein